MSIVKSEDAKKWINAFIAICSILIGYVVIHLMSFLGEYFDLEARVNHYLWWSQGLGVSIAIVSFVIALKHKEVMSYLLREGQIVIRADDAVGARVDADVHAHARPRDPGDSLRVRPGSAPVVHGRGELSVPPRRKRAAQGAPEEHRVQAFRVGQDGQPPGDGPASREPVPRSPEPGLKAPRRRPATIPAWRGVLGAPARIAESAALRQADPSPKSRLRARSRPCRQIRCVPPDCAAGGNTVRRAEDGAARSARPRYSAGPRSRPSRERQSRTG